ncbi:ABC transporter permease [Longispora fulva]|uniref:Putative ABC transport system permease protein n=1 Tax=Longispora fulva TaxID=619741 RepID=A0A8J7GDX1_9ACTN|nr:ABC transporter permease [Longispora fulva]MBG6136899.1 putative ABC transport system permease protein [Longispora fulva]GIG60070.1 ABC transporter permease [Longispora fulva]
MLRMSWQTFRDRWQLFAGAFVAVALGVALVQSSLLALVASVDPLLPAGLSPEREAALRDGYGAAGSLLGMVLFIAGFLAIFVVGSTFAFTVAQRRAELATLRLNGGSRWQLRRLLLGEALILGLLGSATGVALGGPVGSAQLAVLRSYGFVPDSFEAPWRGWVLWVSVGVGVGVGLFGVFGASQRAAKVEPLEALRETGKAGRVMTASRWVLGVLFFGFTTALAAAGPNVGPDDAIGLYLMMCMTLAVALNAVAPLVVPLVGRLLGLLARGPLGELAMANLRAGVRRTASTAAPVLVLVAIVGGLAGSVDTLAASILRETSETIVGELRVSGERPAGVQPGSAPAGQPGGVVALSDPVAIALAALPGVRTVSAETPVDLGKDFPDGLAVDPAAYQATHRVEVISGDLSHLDAGTVAARANALPGHTFRVGEDLVTPKGTLRIVAVLRRAISGPGLLVSREVFGPGAGKPVPAGSSEPGEGTGGQASGGTAPPTSYWLRTDRPDQVTAAIGNARLGEVTTRADWLADFDRDQRRNNTAALLALLGAGALYAAIAVVNAVVIGAADRRAEFAAARLTGLTRAQVVRTALTESLAVVGIGLLLGGLSAAGTVYGVTRSLAVLTGHWQAEPPWALGGALVGVAVLLVATASVASTWMATRIPAVRLAGSRE